MTIKTPKRKPAAPSNQKTINAFDDILNIQEKDFNVFSDSSQGDGIGAWAQENNTQIDLMTLKSLFYSEDWVFICVDRIASRIAAQKLKVVHRVVKDGKTVEQQASDHPAQKIIDNPNEYQDYYQFMYSVVCDLACLGNSVLWMQTASKSIIPIPAEFVRIDFSAQGKINNYQIFQMTWDQIPDLRKLVNVPPENIIHVKRPNPSSLIWGLSPFVAGRKAMLFNRYSSEYLNNYYIKGALPGLALEIGNEANENLALRLLRSFEMAYTGRKNQRRNIVLPKGVTAKEISHKLADQQLIVYLQNNRETIINLLQIPKHELSITDNGGGLGSEDYKTALKNFWSGTLRSTMQLVSGSMTKKFKTAGWLTDEFFLDFDLSDVDVLQEDQLAKAMLAEKLLDTHTINEVRAELYDMPPTNGGDTLIKVPASLSLYGKRQDAAAPPAQIEQPKEPVIEQQAITATAAPAVDQKMEDRKAMLKRNLDAFHPMKTTGTWWRERNEKLHAGFEKHSGKLYQRTLELFGDQAVAAHKIAKDYLKEKAAFDYRTKDEEGKRPPAALINKTELQRRIKVAFAKMEDDYVKDYTGELNGQVELGYNSSLDIPFNMPDKDAVNALRAKNSKGRREMLESRGIDTFENMSKTTTEKVMRTIDNGVEQQMTVQEIANEIAKALGDEEISKGRLMTIARTETLTASSIGQAAAMQDAATVVPNLKKMWLNSDDDRVRGNPSGKYKDSDADHWNLQGDVKAWDEDFTDPGNQVKLKYPRDLDAPPGSTINCRCTFIMMPGDDAEKLGLSDLAAAEEGS